MPVSDIVIKGAREHNLRGVDLVLPRNKLICLTGVSGSGKSSLAFDTLYAEGPAEVRREPVDLSRGSSWGRCRSRMSTTSAA